jgi:hypothetical protein
VKKFRSLSRKEKITEERNAILEIPIKYRMNIKIPGGRLVSPKVNK